MYSRSGAYGDAIESVKHELVSMSDNGLLTRVFDGVKLPDEDIAFFETRLRSIFADEMVGRKLISVTSANIKALQDIIRDHVETVLLSDPKILRALNEISDPVKRDACRRDIVLAFINKVTGKVNTDARISAKLERGSEQDNNAKAYMAFVMHVNNMHNKSAEEVLIHIRKEAKGELAKAVELTRELRNSKSGLQFAGTFSSSSSQARTGEPHPSSRRSLKSPQRDLLRSPSRESQVRGSATRPSRDSLKSSVSSPGVLSAETSSAPSLHTESKRAESAASLEPTSSSSPTLAANADRAHSAPAASAAAAAAADIQPHKLKDERRRIELAKSPPPSHRRRK